MCTHSSVLLGRDCLYCLGCGARVTETPFLIHTPAPAGTRRFRFTPPTGKAPPSASEPWWAAQDSDAAWAQQWENDVDRADPHSYK